MRSISGKLTYMRIVLLILAVSTIVSYSVNRYFYEDRRLIRAEEFDQDTTAATSVLEQLFPAGSSIQSFKLIMDQSTEPASRGSSALGYRNKSAVGALSYSFSKNCPHQRTEWLPIATCTVTLFAEYNNEGKILATYALFKLDTID